MTGGDILNGVALLIASIGGLGGVRYAVKARAEKRYIQAQAAKFGADAAQVLSGAAVSLLDPMRAEIDRLTQRVQTLQAQLDTLTSRLEHANTILAEHGLTP